MTTQELRISPSFIKPRQNGERRITDDALVLWLCPGQVGAIGPLG